MGAYEDIVATAALDIPCQDTGATTSLVGGGTLNTGTAATRSVADGPRPDLPRSMSLANPTSLVEWITTSFSLAGKTTFSYELWFKRFSGGAGWQPLLGSGSDSRTLIGLADFGSNNQCYFSAGGSGALANHPIASAAPANNFNQWLHVVVTQGAGVSKWYTNGALKSTQSLTPVSLAGNLIIGKRNAATDDWLNARVAGVRFFNATLSDAEVAALYAGPQTRRQPPILL